MKPSKKTKKPEKPALLPNAEIFNSMKHLQRDFLSHSITNLEILRKRFSAEMPSENEWREAFRALHTIKGTAQTFGFDAAGSLAHELENLLAAAEFIPEKTRLNLFVEGVELLINSLANVKFVIPVPYIEKLQSSVPEKYRSAADENFAKKTSPEIPDQIIAQLSRSERDALETAQRNGKTIRAVEVGFDYENFSDGFIKLREELNAAGEIIAVSSSANFSGKIGFRILLANAANNDVIEGICAKYAAETIFQTAENSSINNFKDVAAKIVNHGKSLANRLGKRIEFEVSADEFDLSADKLELIFNVLLHLVRNAVDHGFQTPCGKISIRLKKESGGMMLKVADDGSGIDLYKVRQRAIEKKLISADEILSRKATLDLIFQSELSTAAKVTNISGRGVGLDAVKDAVESAGGKISVETVAGEGAAFVIFLPR